MRHGEGLYPRVLFDHAGERGLRGILHGIAGDVAFDVGEAHAQRAVGIGSDGLAGIGDDGAAPLGAQTRHRAFIRLGGFLPGAQFGFQSERQIQHGVLAGA